MAFRFFVTCLLTVVALAISTCTNIVHGQQQPTLPDIPHDYRVTLPEHLRGKNDTASKPDPKLSHIATLGRVLFYDRSLSANNLVSCASCHKQAKGFDDPARFSIGFKGLITSRSAMGLTNARFNANGRYFWDERANSLKDQVMQPFFDPIEMGLKSGELVNKVRAANYYTLLFSNAYGSAEITRAKIASALTSFINAIVSTNSPYDIGRNNVSGPLEFFKNFSDQQNIGKNLFFNSAQNGGAECISCHQTENFISPSGGENNGLDLNTAKDEGVGKITGNKYDSGNFRPPSLRNIAVRAPFMHDGRFSSLETVIDHYSTGIQNHPNLGEPLKNANGSPRRFDFSQKEIDALIAFLETLTDQILLEDPKFSNPFQ